MAYLTGNVCNWARSNLLHFDNLCHMFFNLDSGLWILRASVALDYICAIAITRCVLCGRGRRENCFVALRTTVRSFLSNSDGTVTNLQQNFPLEKTFFQIFGIGCVLIIQKGGKREICYYKTVWAISNPSLYAGEQLVVLEVPKYTTYSGLFQSSSAGQSRLPHA